MVSRNREPKSRSDLLRQIVVALTIVNVLVCTVLGSAVLSTRERSLNPAFNATPTPIQTLPPATRTLVPVATATSTAVVEALPTETPLPSSATPTSALTPTSSPTPLPTKSPQPGQTLSPTLTSLPALTPLPTSTSPPTLTSPAPLPTRTPVPTTVACGDRPFSWVLYVVQRGDTLTQLALRRNTTVDRIVRANCLTTTAIYSGQRLYLPPPPAQPAPTPTACLVSAPDGWVQYIVRAGDTLYGLAQQRGTTIDTVRQVNCLAGYEVYSGQWIYLPPAPTEPTVTAVPTETETVEPTATTIPAETATVDPTATTIPAETATVDPTATTIPAETATVEPTATSAPTETVEPAMTPTELPQTAEVVDPPVATTAP